MRYPNNIAIGLILLLCVAAGCQKDDAAVSRVILTLQVDADFALQGDNWIFATNASGEVLDVEPISSGKTLTLTSAKAADKINVTLFQFDEEPTAYKNTKLNTYADVPVGTTLHYEGMPVNTGPLATAHFELSRADGAFIEFETRNILALNKNIGDNLQADLTFYHAPSDALMTGYRSGVPVYCWAKGVKDGDVVSLDFQDDFTPYPHQFTLNFEGSTSAFVTARNKAGETFYLTDSYFLSLVSPGAKPVIGYIDGFESYQTFIQNTTSQGAVMYSRSGAFNVPLSLPTFTFSPSKMNFLDYAFNFSEAYTNYTITWTYDNGSESIWWQTSAPAGTTITKLSLPDEITSKYPELDVSKLVYGYILITDVKEGKLPVMPGAPEDTSAPVEAYTYRPYP